jgi:hypothetical protein
MRQAQNLPFVLSQYREFSEEAKLSPEQFAALADLLARQQAELPENSRMRQLLDPSFVPLPREEIEARHNAEIAALLGTPVFAQFVRYRDTSWERSFVDMLRDRFAARNAPLEAKQRAELLRILIEEYERIPSPRSSWVVMADITDDSMQKVNEWEDGLDARVRARASSVLTPVQLDYLVAYQQSQKQSRDRDAAAPKSDLLRAMVKAARDNSQASASFQAQPPERADAEPKPPAQ